MNITPADSSQTDRPRITSRGRRLATVATVVVVATTTLGPAVSVAAAEKEGGNSCSVWRCGFNHNEMLASSVSR